MERANQDLGAALQCVTARNPSFWIIHLPWIEYAHNSLFSATTGMSPFECSMVTCYLCFLPRKMKSLYPPSKPIFAAVVTSGKMPALPCSVLPTTTSAFLTITRRTESRKLTLRYTGPYEMDCIINPSAVKLKLPPSMRIHPTFHVSQLKPVSVSPLCLPAIPPPPIRIRIMAVGSKL